jgi:CRISPR/Cas system-associated exonuclease Cas4 (RecB family)
MIAIPTTADLLADTARGLAPPRPKLPRHPIGMWPSEMGGCPRKTTLRLLNYKPADRTGGEVQTMNFGKIFESYVTALWRNQYTGIIERQVPVLTPYGNGKIDLYLPELPKLIEVKTTNWARKDYLPNPSHVDQLLLYMAFFAEWNTANAGELAYGFSDNEDVLQSFVIPYNQERVNELVNWAEQVKCAKDTKTPPPVPEPYHPEKFPCGWLGKNPGRCEYFAFCWKEA